MYLSEVFVGKLKDFLLEQEENEKHNQAIVPNLGSLECPKCGSTDVMEGSGRSICLECDLIDQTGVFVRSEAESKNS